MIWKHKALLKTQALLFSIFLLDASHLANLAQAVDEKRQTKAELPLDAFQTRTLPLAKKYLFEGELDKSKNLLETLLELEPKNAEAHLILAEICIKQKNVERASTLLKDAMRLTTDPDLALKANAWLTVLPTRLTKPKAPVTNKGLNNVETIEDERENSVHEDKSLKILLFTASWLTEAGLVAEQVKEIAQKSGSATEVNAVELGGPKNESLFKEYSISLLPAVVVLKSDGHFLGGASGSQVSRDLKSLLKATK
jgi:tetratricopeptide (TPR) repeat protein